MSRVSETLSLLGYASSFIAPVLIGVSLFFIKGLSRGVRRVLMIIAFIGAAAAIYELYMVFVWSPKVVAPIRIDLLLLLPLLGILNVIAAIILFCHYFGIGSWSGRIIGFVGAFVFLIPPILVMTQFLAVKKEIEVFDVDSARAKKLLFQARFRDPERYQAVFGPFDPNNKWTGHWSSINPRHYYSRIIINARGKVWFLLLSDNNTEWLSAQGEISGPFSSQTKEIKVELKERANQQAVILKRKNDTTLVAQSQYVNQGKLITDPPDELLRTDPPLLNDKKSTVPAALEYLGSYSSITTSKSHVTLAEVWLWKNEDRLFGIWAKKDEVIRADKSDFVMPNVFEAPLFKSVDGVITAQGKFQRTSINLYIVPDRIDARLKFDDYPSLEKVFVMNKKSVIQDELIDLAPLTSASDWQEWFKVHMHGRFFSWDVAKTMANR